MGELYKRGVPIHNFYCVWIFSPGSASIIFLHTLLLLSKVVRFLCTVMQCISVAMGNMLPSLDR